MNDEHDMKATEDRRCGTCRWYNTIRTTKTEVGECIHQLPYWLDYTVDLKTRFPTDGKMCKVWERKET